MAYTKSLTHSPSTAAYWASESVDSDATVTEQIDTTLGCNLVQLGWSRTAPSGVVDDLMTVNFHIAKVVGGGLFSALIAAEFPAVETLIDSWWATAKADVVTSVTFAQIRFWECRASHGAYPDGSEIIGPPIRVTSRSSAGTSIGIRLPDQDSMTATWRTCARKHWGRVYLPGLGATSMASLGQFSTTSVDNQAAAWHTFIGGLTAASQTLGVWTYRRKAFLDITSLQVDDVPDIQRRRRMNRASYRKQYTS